MLNSTHTLASPTPTTLERYLLEFESSMSVSFVSEYSRLSSEQVSSALTSAGIGNHAVRPQNGKLFPLTANSDHDLATNVWWGINIFIRDALYGN